MGKNEKSTLFFYIRIQFIRILRLRFGTNFFRKWGNIRPLQKKRMSNETASREKKFKVIGGSRHIFACLAYINLNLCMIRELFTEFKNLFSFSRYFDSKFQMRFLGNHTKCINSLRN